MKYIYVNIVLIFIITNSSCDPNAGKDIFNSEIVNLKATIVSNSENITLGDTILIKLKVPDTLVTSGSTQIIQTLQRGQFALILNYLDTASRAGIGIRPPNIWTINGNLEGNFSYVVNSNTKPYEVVIACKPPMKGLYLIEIISQSGQLKINNNYEAKLIVNFNVPNKHLNILSIVSPYFGGQQFYDAAVQKDNDGFGNYYFRVN